MMEWHSGKRTLEMILATGDFYFPPTLRERYDRIAAAFEAKSQYYWIERAAAKRDATAEAFRKLGEWADMCDAELLMSAWEDEVFFFYVLRTQFVFSRIAADPDGPIPGTFDGFWKWAMTPQNGELWMSFPVFTEQNYRAAPVKPPIWRIPYPKDYPQSA